MTDEAQGQALTTTDERPTRLPSLAAGGTVAAIIPTTFEECYRLGKAFHAAGMAPKGLNSPEACMGVIIAGAELGLPPYMSLQSFANINGRTSIWGDAVPALLWSHGFKLKEWMENSDPAYPDAMVAKCIVTRPDGTEIEGEFSVGDAKEAKLWTKDGPWQTARKRMLKMRARGFAARDGASDVLRGMHLVEEVQDYEEFDEAPAKAPKAKRDLSKRLQTGQEAAAALPAPNEPGEEEKPPHDPHTGEIIDAEVEEIDGDEADQVKREIAFLVEHGTEASAAAAMSSEERTQLITTITHASKGGGTGETQAADDEPRAWWEDHDVAEGHAAVGQTYRMSGDQPNASGRIAVYMNGGPHSTVSEKAGRGLTVYAEHAPPLPKVEDKPAAPKAEPKAEAPAEAAAITASPEDRRDPAQDAAEEAEPAEPSYGDKIKAAKTWVDIKAAWVDLNKTPEWKEFPADEQDQVRAMTWVEAARVGADALGDPTAFGLWIYTQTDPAMIGEALSRLEEAPTFKNASEGVQAAVRNRAAARIAAVSEAV